MAQVAKAGLKILAVSIYASLTASIFSSFILFTMAVFFGDADSAGSLLSGFFVISFVMGLPAFLVLGVPVLHLIPRLKHARPRYAALAGAISAAIVDCWLYLFGHVPELTDSLRAATIFFGSTIVWAAFAGLLYQYTRKSP